jgi:hypothetical protein
VEEPDHPLTDFLALYHLVAELALLCPRDFPAELGQIIVEQKS